MIIRKLEALFTINTSRFRQATFELDKFSSKIEGVMALVAGSWVAQGLQNFMANTAQTISEVGKAAGFLGITTEALQELRYAAEKSGIAVDTLDDSLKELQIRAVDATTGSGEAFDAFNKLGLKTTDAAGRMREPLELLDEVADRLLKLPTQSERIWVLDSMLGDSGAEMLKVLKDGSVGLKRLRQEARSLGHLLAPDSISKADRFTQALNRMKTAFGGVSSP